MTFATYSRFGCRLFRFNLLLGELFCSEFILSQLLGFGTVEVAEAHVFPTTHMTSSMGCTLPRLALVVTVSCVATFSGPCLACLLT
ncbi:hypothetical protein Hanom_Chr12g01156071 [Helianthus anomalus]